LSIGQAVVLEALDNRVGALEQGVHLKPDGFDGGQVCLEICGGRAGVNGGTLAARGYGDRGTSGGREQLLFQTATMALDVRTAFAPVMRDDRPAAEYGPRTRATAGTWRDMTWM
jgi:hypothetical protein